MPIAIYYYFIYFFLAALGHGCLVLAFSVAGAGWEAILPCGVVASPVV